MTARFLQFHTLTSYPASLLNRDDAGFAKRMPFGGAVRTRISSQCLKRHWRIFDGQNGLGEINAPSSVRSRVSFEKYIVEPLVAEGISLEQARMVTQKIVGHLLGSEQKKAKAKKSGGKKAPASQEPKEEPVATAQVTVLGRPELDYLCDLARKAISTATRNDVSPGEVLEAELKNRELKKNITALTLGAGLGAALFGRMVTGDILARTDAAIHVAHALTVHGQMTESDYFSAIDDLAREEGEQGSGHINASELTSGLFYGYVVVDVDALVGNLGGDRELASEVVQRLAHIIATVSPGAKKGSTAPYAYSHLVLAESGKAQPRTLQNAFLEPVRTTGSLVDNAYIALQGHLGDLDEMYGKSEQRAHAGLKSKDYFDNGMSLAVLADWARKLVVA